jgi:hypothetical protein
MRVRGEVPRRGELPRPRRPAGVHSDDLLRIDTVLSGLSYPVERWELLDHATRTPPTPNDAPTRAPSTSYGRCPTGAITASMRSSSPSPARRAAILRASPIRHVCPCCRTGEDDPLAHSL